MEDLYMFYGIEQQSTKKKLKKTWLGHLTRGGGDGWSPCCLSISRNANVPCLCPLFMPTLCVKFSNISSNFVCNIVLL